MIYLANGGRRMNNEEHNARMSGYTYLPDDILLRRAIDALFDALGPVEATRFLNLARLQPVNAVEQHR